MILSAQNPRLRLDLLLALLAGSGAAIVYFLGSAPGVLFGDGGELQFAAWTAGLPHPTGYPLYMTLGWAWSHLLDAAALAPPARAMTLLSVLFGGLAVGLTYLLARALIDLGLPQASPVLQRLAALLAALTFAFTPTFWSQAVVTEVYTLHAAFVALILWLVLLWRVESVECRVKSEGWIPRVRGVESASLGPVCAQPPGGAPRRGEGTDRAPSGRIDPLLAALALTFGLSLAHHRTTLLLAPFVLGFLAWQAPAGYWRHHRRDILWMALLALAPLLLYFYVPLRANATPYLTMTIQPGQPVSLLDRSPAGLISYLLGRGFAGELQSLSAALTATPGLLGRFAAELTPLGAGLAMLGVGVLIARRRWGLLWLTGGSFAALTAFNLFYTIGDIAVFYVPSYLIACTWVGVAMAWLTSLIRIPRPVSQSPSEVQEIQPTSKQTTTGSSGNPSGTFPFAVLPFVVIFLLLPTYLFVSHAASLDRSQDTRAQDWWDALLAANPPQGAMLISNDRDEMMPLWYMQQVEGRRPDLAGVFPLLLTGEGSAPLRSETSWATIGQAVDSALATGRPVSLIKPMPGLEIKAQLGPPGAAGLTPVLGPAVTGPPAHPQDVIIGDEVRLIGYTGEPGTVQPGQSLAIDLYWQPLRTLPANYTSFVQLLSPDGNKVAQSDHLVGGEYYPTGLWQPGETLLDRHTLDVPDSAPPGPYRLFVGLYELVDGEARTVGGVMVNG